jgi:2'-5' RNA ligase
MRLFLAINLPREIKFELANLLKGLNDPGLKKISPENLHLTIKFLGEVDKTKSGQIKQCLSEVHAMPFKVSLEGIGFFPNGNRIKVIWIGVKEGSQEMVALQKEIDLRLSDIGLPKERDFQPHLTIARVKFIKDPQRLIESVKSAKVSASFQAGSFDLMESVLRPEGPQYMIASKYKLIID